MPPKDLSGYCRALVSQLDEFRTMWLGVVLELLDGALQPSGYPIVNRTFDEDRIVPAMAISTPADFPFNSVNGLTVESAIIGFQSVSALQFSLARGYIAEDDFSDYSSELLRASNGNRRWLFSIGALFGDSGAISADTVAYVLSRYFMNTESATEAVQTAQSILDERLPFLQYFSQVGTAIAFGDHATATTMMQQLGP